MNAAATERSSYPPNPYVIGVPLTGEAGFYGRRDVFQFIKETLDTRQQNVVVLYGQRRVGKTSILHQSMQQLANEGVLLPVYFDLQGKGRQSLAQVLFQLSREIGRELDIENDVPTTFDEDGRFFADQFLPQLATYLGTQRRVLLLFDEFDVLGDEVMASGAGAEPQAMASEALFPYLQDLIMHQDRLAFLFVVGRRIDELPTHFSAIFKQAAYRRIGLLKPEDARALIVEPTRGVINFTGEAIDAILELTSGHPYFTQLICFEIYSYLRNKNQRKVSQSDIAGLVDQAIETGHGALNWFWDGLPRAERFILSAIAHVSDAQGVAAKPSIQQILEKHRVVLTGLELQDAPERLVEWEILNRRGTEAYRFTVELVRRWMLKLHPLESARRDVDYISKRAVQLHAVAREAHTAGMLEDARDDYRKALTANPNHSGAQLGLAQVLFELGEIEAAVEAFQTAYAIDEMSGRDGLVRARTTLGERYEQEGRQADALVEYHRALQYAPQDDGLRRRLATIWLSRAAEAFVASGPTSAYEAYQEALNVDTDGSVAAKVRLDFDDYVRRAESERREEDAVTAFDVLRRLLPDDASAQSAEAEYFCRRGDALLGAGRQIEAIRAYDRALEVRSDDSVLIAKLEGLSAEWRRLREANTIFSKGWMAHHNEDWETAKSAWIQLIKMDVLDYEEHDIAALLSEAGRRAKQTTRMQPVTRKGAPQSAKATEYKSIYVALGIVVAGIVLLSSGVVTTERQDPGYSTAADEVQRVSPISPGSLANQDTLCTETGGDISADKLSQFLKERRGKAFDSARAAAAYHEGQRYYSSGHVEEAVRCFYTAAMEGDRAAMIQLGRMFLRVSPGNIVSFGTEGEKFLQLSRGEELRAKKQAATPEKASRGR
ncbi:MAG: tetratricopeptide repeat protein [Chromatiales bacterium]